MVGTDHSPGPAAPRRALELEQDQGAPARMHRPAPFLRNGRAGGEQEQGGKQDADHAKPSRKAATLAPSASTA